MRDPNRNVFVVCVKPGYIPFLGICGPIANPISIPAKMCLNIITSGVCLFEMDLPTKDTVELTSDNVFEDDNFGNKTKVTEVLPHSEGPITDFGVESSTLSRGSSVDADPVTTEPAKEVVVPVTTEPAKEVEVVTPVAVDKVVSTTDNQSKRNRR